MNDWQCPKCGFRFLLITPSGKERAAKHESEGCDVPQAPAEPIPASKGGAKFVPGVTGKRYPPRRKGRNGY